MSRLADRNDRNLPKEGDASRRKVRELIELATLGECSLCGGGGRKLMDERRPLLVCEDMDDLRRSVRFVWTFSTAVCPVLTLRNAVAAAAADVRLVDG